MRIGYLEKREEVVCPTCAKAWTYSYNFYNHNSRMVGLGKTLTCDECIERKKQKAIGVAEQAAYDAALRYGTEWLEVLRQSEMHVIRRLLAKDLRGGLIEYWRLVKEEVEK